MPNGLVESAPRVARLVRSDSRYSGSSTGRVADGSVRYRLSARGFPLPRFASAASICVVSWSGIVSRVKPLRM